MDDDIEPEVDTDSVVRIDESRLDVEWLKQPRRVMKFAMMLADAKKDMLEAKANLDLVEAELRLEITKNPEDFDLPKTTEKIIDAAIQTQEKYKKALKKYNHSRHRVDILTGIIEALQHRKKALEDLVTLHGQNYFSEPRASKEDQERLDDSTRRSVPGVRQKKRR